MSNPLRIIFMGTPDFAVPSLQALVQGEDTLVAVVCQPDRPRGRGKKLEPPPVKQAALVQGLPVLQPHSVKNPDFLAELAELKPDLLVVVAYGRILPEAILTLAPLGAINVHGSLLPRYRGAAPIQWAVLNGDQESGVTIMQLDAGMDTGPMLLRATAAIHEDDTAGSLAQRLAGLGAGTLLKAIEGLKNGTLAAEPQDHEQASHAPMLNKAQGHVDWSLPAARLHCLIRGLDPWPSAYGFLNGVRYRFFAPRSVAKTSEAVPGTVCRADQEGLFVATGDGMLCLREIQPEGKKRMPVAACLHGNPIEPGMVFT